MEKRIAEVIEASTAQFTAQCYELYELPPLGSLVKTGDIYGIVCHAETAGLEPGRRPIARGKDEASEEAVYQSSPQLLNFYAASSRRWWWAIKTGINSINTSPRSPPASTALSTYVNLTRLKSSASLSAFSIF